MYKTNKGDTAALTAVFMNGMIYMSMHANKRTMQHTVLQQENEPVETTVFVRDTWERAYPCAIGMHALKLKWNGRQGNEETMQMIEG